MDESLFHIQAKESGERIDALLARTVADLTRSGAQRLLEDGCVSLDGAAVKKNYKVRAGDRFTVELPPPADLPLIPQALPLDIVFEDEDVIVVNKARGMVVHPAPGHPDGTLVNALLYHCGDSLSGIGGEKRPGIVHRIDKDTSGLLIVAKNDFAHQQLSAQLADRSLSRIYEAVVHGSFREDSGTVDRPRDRPHPSDPGAYGQPRPPPAGGFHLWRALARKGPGGTMSARPLLTVHPSPQRRRHPSGERAAALFPGCARKAGPAHRGRRSRMKSKKLGTLVVVALVAVLLIALIYRIVAGLLGLMNTAVNAVIGLIVIVALVALVIWMFAYAKSKRK